jgi:hypothetical protein
VGVGRRSTEGNEMRLKDLSKAIENLIKTVGNDKVILLNITIGKGLDCNIMGFQKLVDDEDNADFDDDEYHNAELKESNSKETDKFIGDYYNTEVKKRIKKKQMGYVG